MSVLTVVNTAIATAKTWINPRPTTAAAITKAADSMSTASLTKMTSTTVVVRSEPSRVSRPGGGNAQQRRRYRRFLNRAQAQLGSNANPFIRPSVTGNKITAA